MSSLKLKIPAREGSAVFRMIATSLHSGLSLTETLELVFKNNNSRPVRSLVQSLMRSINRGGSVGPVFTDYKHVLPAAIPAIIQMGETTGKLPEAFTWSAEIFDFIRFLRKRIINAFLYPAFIVLLGIIVLPAPLIFTSGFMAYLTSVSRPLFAITGGYLLFRIFQKLIQGSPAWDISFSRVILKLPVIGSIVKNISLTWFVRTLSVSIKAGLDIMNSLELACNSIQNAFIRRKLKKMISGIASGRTLSEELLDSGFFSNLTMNLIRSGEMTGNLDTMLDKCESILQEDIQTSVQRSTILLGPIVFIIVAIYFAIQIVGFWQNYFSQLEQLPLP